MHRNSERGAVLLATLMVLLALSVIGLATIFLAGSQQEIAVGGRTGNQALYVAEAGANWGMNYAKANPASVAAGYTTDIQLKDGSTNIPAPGSINPTFPQFAAATVTIGQSLDAKGKSVECGIPGYSDGKYGRRRFRVGSIGYGPVSSRREVEIHVKLGLETGLCGGNLVSGQESYAGGG